MAKMIVHEIGTKIRRDRHAKGLTLKQLSSKVGISLTTLQRIETGVVSPSVDLIVEIAYQLGKPVTTYIPDKLTLVRVIPKNEQKLRRREGMEVRCIANPDLLKENINIEVYEVKAGWSKSEGGARGVILLFCIAGSLELTHRGEIFPVEQDGVLIFDSGHPFTLKAPVDTKFFSILCGA